MRRQAFISLTAITLEGKLDNVKNIGVALANNSQIKTLISAGKWEEAIKHIQDVPTDFPYIERLALVDPRGRMHAVFPFEATAVGAIRDHRDWYKGVMRTHAPYISEVYTSTHHLAQRVVACAVPITQADHNLIGMLVLQIPIDKLVTWAQQVDVGPSGFVYFVDQYGHRIGHPSLSLASSSADFPPYAPVQRVLRGERGVIQIPNPLGEDFLAAYEPITNGWGCDCGATPFSRIFPSQ